MKMMRLDAITPSEFSQGLYNPEPSVEMVESVRANGILVPLVVNQDNILISGHCRRSAGMLVGREEAEVIVLHTKDEAHLKKLVVEHNRQRVKTCRELLGEAEYWREVLRPQAEENQRAGGRGKVFLESEKVDTLKSVAEKVGISSDKLWKLETINRRAPNLLAEIDEGRLSVHEAFTQIAPRVESKQRERSQWYQLDSTRAIYLVGLELVRQITPPLKSKMARRILKRGLLRGLAGLEAEEGIGTPEDWALAVKHCPILRNVEKGEEE